MSESVTAGEEKESWYGLISPERRVASGLIFITTGLFAFSEFFVSAAMPSAAVEFSAPWLLPWSFILFLVVSITLGAAGSAIVRRFGLRSPLATANAVFILGSGLSAVADEPYTLLIGRALQGGGEGAAIAISYTLISRVYSGGLIARVFGLESVVWSLAAFAAPAVAGALTQYVSWRAPFLLGVPAAVIALSLSFLLPPTGERGEVGEKAPWKQLSLLALAILSLSLTAQVRLVGAVGLLLLAGLFFTLFLRADRKGEGRILPIGAFSSNSLLSNGLWVTLLMPVASSAGQVYFIYGLINVMGLQTFAASLVSALLAVSWSLIAFGVSNLGKAARERCIRFGVPLLVAAFVFYVAGFVFEEVLLGAVARLLAGAAFGLTWGPLGQLLMERAAPEERDRTSSLLPPLQSAGYAIGGAIFGFTASLAGLEQGASGPAIQTALVVVYAGGGFFACMALFFGLRLRRFLKN